MPIGAETYGSPTYGEGVLVPDLVPSVHWDVSWFTKPIEVPSWIAADVTAKGGGRLRSFTVNRGRSHELDRMQAGTLDLRADNRDRYLDPMYADGPWFGHVKPRRRSRLRVRWNGTTYGLFHGFFDGLPQSYQNPSDGYVDVKATDAFKFFSTAKLPKSVYALEVLADNPKCRYRLAEQDPPSGTPLNVRLSAIESMQTGFDAGYSADPAVALGKTGAIVGDDDTTVLFPGGGDDTGSWTQATLSIPVENAVGGTGDFSVEFWFFGDPGFFFEQYGPGGGFAWQLATIGAIFNNGDGTFTIHRDTTWSVFDFDGNARQVLWSHNQTFSGSVDLDGFLTTPFTDEFDQRWHHMVGVRQGDDLALYCDGALVGTETGTLNEVPLGPSGLRASESPGIDNPADDPRSITCGQIAFYESALSSSRVLAHFQAGTGPWANLTTGALIARILDAVGWSGSDRDLDAGSSTLTYTSLGDSGSFTKHPFLTGSAMAMDLLNLAVDSEFGELWMTTEGKVRFRERLGIYTTPRYTTPQAVFGDAGPGTDELPYTDITPIEDDVQIRNDISITAQGGTEQTARDQDSIDDYFASSYSRTGLLIDDDEAAEQAAWILGRYKQPQLRVERILISPRRDPARLFPVIFSLDIGDMVRIVRRPQGVGDPITQDCFIEGLRLSFEAKDNRWEMEYRLSPTPAFGAFLTDDSLLDGADTTVY